MIGAIAKRFLGSANDRIVRGLMKTAEKINDLESGVADLDDAALRARTGEFRQRIADGDTRSRPRSAAEIHPRRQALRQISGDRRRGGRPSRPHRRGRRLGRGCLRYRLG